MEDFYEMNFYKIVEALKSGPPFFYTLMQSWKGRNGWITVVVIEDP